MLVPTHDLAVQIHAVVRAVTRGRAWRCLLLAKATQKAVCGSSPGLQFSSAPPDDSVDEEAGASGDEDEEDGAMDQDDDESTGSVNEFAPPSGVPTNTAPRLGVDMLIATPERLHHLVEGGLLSLTA